MASTSPSRPRRVPPDQALPEPALGVSQATGAGAVSGALGGAAAAAVLAQGVRQPVAPVIALLRRGPRALGLILEAMRAFRIRAAAVEDAWVVKALQRVEGITQADIMGVVVDERARRAEFDRKQEDRLRRDVTRVLALPEGQRADALSGVLRREQVYSFQRADAVAVRSLALADRITLRRDSPAGAFWVFQDDERTTVDCRMMGGQFWPWPALDILCPPTHIGCRCLLRSYEWALGAGLIKSGSLMDVDTAVRRALAAKAQLHEADAWRSALAEAGICSPSRFDDALLRSAGRSK